MPSRANARSRSEGDNSDPASFGVAVALSPVVIPFLTQLPQFGPIQIFFASFFGDFGAAIAVSPFASVGALGFASETAM